MPIALEHLDDIGRRRPPEPGGERRANPLVIPGFGDRQREADELLTLIGVEDIAVARHDGRDADAVECVLHLLRLPIPADEDRHRLRLESIRAQGQQFPDRRGDRGAHPIVLGERLRLGRPLFQHLRRAVIAHHDPVQRSAPIGREHRRARRAVRGSDRWEGDAERGAKWYRGMMAEQRLDGIDQFRGAAVVHAEGESLIRRGGRREVGADVGTSEGVDRLLRVSDEEEGTPSEGVPEDRELEGVGILELVDEGRSEALPDPLGQRALRPLARENVAEAAEEIIEGEGMALAPLASRPALYRRDVVGEEGRTERIAVACIDRRMRVRWLDEGTGPGRGIDTARPDQFRRRQIGHQRAPRPVMGGAREELGVVLEELEIEVHPGLERLLDEDTATEAVDRRDAELVDGGECLVDTLRRPFALREQEVDKVAMRATRRRTIRTDVPCEAQHLANPGDELVGPFLREGDDGDLSQRERSLALEEQPEDEAGDRKGLPGTRTCLHEGDSRGDRDTERIEVIHDRRRHARSGSSKVGQSAVASRSNVSR